MPAATGSLGLSLQWTPLAAATGNVWHVLDVAANSPADAAGLLPYGDYIIGAPADGFGGAGGLPLHGEAALGELVDDHAGRPLRLWVYNHEYDVTREVEVTPSREWGGEGALGCVLGYGALHRIPAPLSEPVHGPGETLFDGDGEKFAMAAADAAGTTTNVFVPAAAAVASPGVTTASPPPAAGGPEFLIPAQVVGATGTPPPAAGSGTATAPPPRGGRKKERAGHAAPSQLDDYFAEQEQKSKELDGGAISASKTPPPPPPKAGVPPPPKATPKPQAAPADEGGEGGRDGGDGEES